MKNRSEEGSGSVVEIMKRHFFSNAFASEETDEKGKSSRQPEVVRYWRH